MRHTDAANMEFDDEDLSSYDLRITNRAVPPNEDEDEYDSYEEFDWSLDPDEFDDDGSDDDEYDELGDYSYDDEDDD